MQEIQAPKQRYWITFWDIVPKEWIWVFFLAFGLAFIADDFASPIGSLGFSILWMLIALGWQRIYAEFKADKGPLWLWLPLGIIGLSALVHALIGHSLTDAMGLLIVIMCYGIYLLARSFYDRLPYTLAILSAAGSVSLIISKSINPIASIDHFRPGLFGCHHITCFIILAGLIVAPPKTRPILLVVGIPAIIMSASEEGIACLVVLGLLAIVKRDWNRRVLLGLGAVSLLVIALVLSGWFSIAYYNIKASRFTADIQTLSHERWAAYKDYWYNAPFDIGGGWEWNVIGSQESEASDWPDKWQTVHNSPLRIAGHFGIVAGLAWLGIMLWAFWVYRRTPYAYVFALILAVAMLDHMMWTHLPIWPFALLGIATIDKH